MNRLMRHKMKLLLAGSALLLVILLVQLLVSPKKATSPAIDAVNDTQSTETEDRPNAKDEQQSFELIDAQPVINAWGVKQSGQYSIYVYDLENQKVIGSHQPNDIYFAASIYKLYVAYEGYLAAQRGDYKLNEPYLNGQTREVCLDKMIRESDSPCAEKLWNELGKEQQTTTLQTYGINNTSMIAITTTAKDAGLMLKQIYEAGELNSANRARFLQSMKTQIYREGLAKSFSGSIFYDKVGFRGTQEYHDVGILELDNGRHYVISLLTSNVGRAQVRELGDSLFALLNTKESRL